MREPPPDGEKERRRAQNGAPAGMRDRDAAGRPRNARPRDELGRPLRRVGPAVGIEVQTVPLAPVARALKRAIDIVVSAGVAAFVAPAFLVVVEPLTTRKRFDPRELLLGVAIVPGVALVVGGTPGRMHAGVLVVDEGVAPPRAQAGAVDAVDGEVHLGHPPGLLDALLAVDQDVLGVTIMLGDEPFRLHEHPARTAARVIHASAGRFEDLDNHPDDAGRGEEFAAAPSLRAGEIAEEVFVDLPHQVAGTMRVTSRIAPVRASSTTRIGMPRKSVARST